MKSKLLILALVAGSFWSFAQNDSLLTVIQKQQYVLDLLLKDTDKDNVPDYWDKCTETPLGARIDGSGCALDMDLDGIIDLYDRCVSTPGIRALQGCSETVFPDVNPNDYYLNFPSKSTDFDKTIFLQLEDLTNLIYEFGEGKVFIIEGHANEYKSEKKNLTLSLQRAQKVKDYMIQHGIKEEQLEVKAVGSKDLLYPECENIQHCWKNGKDYLNERNRRVVFKVVKNEE